MAFAPDYPIETERLTLRPFTRGDVDAVFSYRGREDVCRFLFDEPMSRQSCAEAIQLRIGQLAFEEDGDRIVLAVERKSDGVLIGEVSLILRSSDSRQAEIGYIFHPDSHRQGYATEAARALMEVGFKGADLHRIYARCDARNTASARVMERLGMRREAHFRGHVLIKGRWDEEFIYALLEDEWRAQGNARHAARVEVPAL
jgi:RimJ/RimL family protein N-acetyltransferase